MGFPASLQRHAVFIPFAILFASAFFLETSMHRVVFYILSAFLIAMICRENESRFAALRTNSFFLVAGYGLFFTASTLWGETLAPYLTFRALVDALCIVVFCLAVAVAGPKFSIRPRHSLYVAAICVGAVGVFALIFYGLGDKDLNSRFYGQGRFYNPIHMSILLSMAVLFVFACGLKGDIKSKSIQIFLILAMIFFIFLSQTRSSLMGLVACIPVLFLFGGRKFVLPLIGASLVAGIIMFFAWGNTLSELYARGDTHRFDIWQESLRYISQKPIVGHGIASEPTFGEKGDREGYKSAHNFILGHLYYGGIVGLVLALSILINGLRQAWVAIRQYGATNDTFGILARFTFLSLCFCAVASLFNFSHYMVGVHIQWLIFWLPVALAWYLEIVNRKNHAETP